MSARPEDEVDQVGDTTLLDQELVTMDPDPGAPVLANELDDASEASASETSLSPRSRSTRNAPAPGGAPVTTGVRVDVGSVAFGPKGQIWTVVDVVTDRWGVTTVGVASEAERQTRLLPDLLCGGWLIVDPSNPIAHPPLHSLLQPRRKELLALAADLNWVRTGHLSGRSDLLHADEEGVEPPDGARTERAKNLAERKGWSLKTVWRKYSAHKDKPVVGLLTKSERREYSRPQDGVSPFVLAAVYQVFQRRLGDSTLSQATLLEIATAHLEKLLDEARKNGLKVDAQMPGRTRAYELIRSIGRRYGNHQDVRTADSNQRAPLRTGRGFRDEGPGTLVIDELKADVMLLGDTTGKQVRTRVLSAMNVASRAIAGNLVCLSATSREICALIYDAMGPKRVEDDWPEEGSQQYLGLPDQIYIDLPTEFGEDRYGLANCPYGRFDKVIVDNGSPMIGIDTLEAFAQAGLSVQFSRPYVGADKANLERFHRTLRRFIETLPGYLGSRVGERGLVITVDMTVSEFTYRLRRWIALEYHNTPSTGLISAFQRGLVLAPMDKWAENLLRSGLCLRVPDPMLRVRLLPYKAATLTRDGVTVNKIRYYDEELLSLLDEASPHRELKGLWPVHYHPYAPQLAFLRDEPRDRIIELRATNLDDPNVPFASAARAYEADLVRDSDTRNGRLAVANAERQRRSRAPHLVGPTTRRSGRPRPQRGNGPTREEKANEVAADRAERTASSFGDELARTEPAAVVEPEQLGPGQARIPDHLLSRIEGL